MEAIDGALWPRLYAAFQNDGIGQQQQVKFAERPGEELRRLYESCFGTRNREWHSIRCLEAFVALIGAAIHSKVFAAGEQGSKASVLKFESAVYERTMHRLLQLRGEPLSAYVRYQ
jgi:hypothetical protein